jgi:hypothetical protein
MCCCVQQPLSLVSVPSTVQPVVHQFKPTVQNSGFEMFTVEFPWSEPGLA